MRRRAGRLTFEAGHPTFPRRRKRAAIGLAGTLAIAALAVPAMRHPAPRLVWNASASAPVGLYWLRPGMAIRRGDLVLAEPPADSRRLAAERGYLPAGIALVKRVTAMAGDLVCVDPPAIRIGGRRVASILSADRQGRPLRPWDGCRSLGPDELFLLMGDAPDSFDSRYFGPVGGWDPRPAGAAMDPLTGAALAATMLVSRPGIKIRDDLPGPTITSEQRADIQRWDAEIAAAASRFALPEAWIRAVIAAESAGDARAVSPKGAMGLMQLMPETWQAMREHYDLAADPFDPGDNVLAGAAYLRLMVDRFGMPDALAAYNAGPEALAAAQAGVRPLPDESLAYRDAVGAGLGFPASVRRPALAYGTGSGGLFFILNHERWRR